MKGECQGRKHLRQREAEGKSKCKGPVAAVSPAVNQEKARLLGRQPMPGLIMGCLSDLPAPSARPLCRGQPGHSHVKSLLVGTCLG